jgi:uncharacterized protein YfiM (DUF2279 family)
MNCHCLKIFTGFYRICLGNSLLVVCLTILQFEAKSQQNFKLETNRFEIPSLVSKHKLRTANAYLSLEYHSKSRDYTFKADSSQIHKQRLKLVVGATALGYTGAMVGLGTLWYSDYAKGNFHFFNDNDGWMYMDKLGHFTTAYYVGRAGIEALRWANVPDKKAIWLGGSLGLFFLTSVEYFDGRSTEWGASPMDLVANTAGAALVIGQELAWKEQRITMKWSYTNSRYAKYSPDKLGTALNEKWLKDYNGQTYWLSANVSSFLNKKSKLPKWLNLAVGYGANGMLAAVENPTMTDEGIPIPQFERYRQWYISPDIDLPRIKTKSKIINLILKAGGFIKVPLPALEYNRVDNLKFHWLFF